MRAFSTALLLGLACTHALVATPACARPAGVAARAVDLGSVSPLAVGGSVVGIGGAGYFLQQKAAAKAAEEAFQRELAKEREFNMMKSRDKSAAIISLGLPAAVSVIFAGWLVTQFF